MIDIAIRIFEQLYPNATLHVGVSEENSCARMYVPVDVEGKELETTLLYKFEFDGSLEGLYNELKAYVMMHNVRVCADAIMAQLPGQYTRAEALEAAVLIFENMLTVLYGLNIARNKLATCRA